MRRLLVVLLFALCATVCRAQSPAPAPPHGHGAHHGHDFGDVEEAVRMFEAPDRDEWQKPDAVVAALRLRSGQVVADIGASTGYFSRRLARAVGPTGKVWALDVAPAVVEYVNARATKDGQLNLIARRVAPDDPGLAADSVDLVLIVDTLHHIEHRPAYYGRLLRALRKGGRVVVIDFLPRSPFGPPPSERLSQTQVEGELRAAGLRIVERPTFLPYQYFIIATHS